MTLTEIQAQMKPVESTNIGSVGFVDGVLYVAFKGRPTVYAYGGVPAELAAEFMSAKSPGSFFHGRIRSKFPAEKVEPEAEEKDA